jgi:hypothetical protein
MKTCSTGTVSHGTLRESDLISRFLSKLDSCNPSESKKLRKDYGIRSNTNIEKWVKKNPDDAGYLLNDELFEALQEVAPPGHYFGAHEGDGSDFGFWPTEGMGDIGPVASGLLGAAIIAAFVGFAAWRLKKTAPVEIKKMLILRHKALFSNYDHFKLQEYIPIGGKPIYGFFVGTTASKTHYPDGIDWELAMWVDKGGNEISRDEFFAGDAAPGKVF